MESGQLRWNGKIHPTLIIFPSQKSRAPDDYPTVARVSIGFGLRGPTPPLFGLLTGFPAYHVLSLAEALPQTTSFSCNAQKVFINFPADLSWSSMNSEEFRKAAHSAVDESKFLLTP